MTTPAITPEERAPRTYPPSWYNDAESYDERCEAFDEGFTAACDMLADIIGAGDWVMGDGSESWDGDASITLINVLRAGGLYDDDNGTAKAALSAAEARIQRLAAVLVELADDCEAEVEHRYKGIKDHPAMTPKYERDMDAVRRARAALEGKKK